MTGQVAVVIAAKDAAPTVGRAVASALAEREVAEVVVVDDGSADATAAAAAAAGDGTGRLRVERLARNRGPSAARNRALALSAAPFIAVLDADDAVLPGRFGRLFAIPDWDMAADNIVFVPEAAAGTDPAMLPRGADAVRDVSLADLLRTSTSRYGRGRTQLGFLKPVIRRAALDAAGLRWDERAWLGEDLLLYAGLLAAGARFRLTAQVGYLAVERAASLSARHRTEDLARLLEGEEELLARLSPDDQAARAALRCRISDTRRKWALRAFLDRKRTGGLAAAVRGLGPDPSLWYGVAEGIVIDKARATLGRILPRTAAGGPRLLMPVA